MRTRYILVQAENETLTCQTPFTIPQNTWVTWTAGAFYTYDTLEAVPNTTEDQIWECHTRQPHQKNAWKQIKLIKQAETTGYVIMFPDLMDGTLYPLPHVPDIICTPNEWTSYQNTPGKAFHVFRTLKAAKETANCLTDASHLWNGTVQIWKCKARIRNEMYKEIFLLEEVTPK